MAALVLLHCFVAVRCEDTDDSDDANELAVDGTNGTLSEDVLQQIMLGIKAADVRSDDNSKLGSTKETNATNLPPTCKAVCQYKPPKLLFLSEVVCSYNGLFKHSICSSEVTCMVEDESEHVCDTTQPPQQKERRPKCEEETGCDVPLRCFNFSSLANGSIVPEPPSVVHVDSYQLQDILENSSIENCCALVMFYAPWCVFSTNFAPKFNALGQTFRELPTLALNYGEHDPNKYVLAYIPVIALYHRGKIVFRFRLSSTYEELIDIVARMTGFIPMHLNLSESELLQPVPTERVDDSTVLYLAMCWLAFVAAVFALRSSRVAACIEHLKSRLRTSRTQQEEKAE